MCVCEWVSEWVTVGDKLTHAHKMLKEKSYYFKPNAAKPYVHIDVRYFSCLNCILLSMFKNSIIYTAFAGLFLFRLFSSIIYCFICLHMWVCVCLLSGKVKSPFIKFNLKTYLFVSSLCLSPPHHINVACVAFFSLVFFIFIWSVYVSNGRIQNKMTKKNNNNKITGQTT